MKVTMRLGAASLLLLLALTIIATAQQKRPTTPRPQPRAAAAPAPPPTFDTLLPADSYVIYGEVRGVGQLVRSSALNELLEPVLKLAGPPKEFRTVIRWLNAQADDVMTSRLLVAGWPTVNAKQLPEAMIAIEFDSAEEATKFAGTLNEFLLKVLPPSEPEASKADRNTAPPQKPKPNFYLERLGSLIVITPRPWTMKQLKPAGSKLLADDPHFRTARNRFNSEPVFAFVNIKAIEREDEERQKRNEEEGKRQRELAKQAREAPAEESKPDEDAADAFTLSETRVGITTIQGDPPELAKAPQPDLFSPLAGAFFTGASEWPDALGLALSFDGDTFDLRALMVNDPGEKADVVPFWPKLIPGPGFSPEAANILPANTDLFVTVSLDLPQIYAAMSKPPVNVSRTGITNVNLKEAEFVSPFASIEQKLKFKLNEDLLPLLGSEISLSLPMMNMNFLGLPGVGMIQPGPPEQKENSNSPVLAIAVKDKDGVRALMPKLIENLAFKGASALAQTERREDTEIVSYAGLFSYAFIGNFIVLTTDPATTRRVVDSYLKHETLSSDVNFRNATRWQPRPLQGQIYISNSLMESYKVWAQNPNTRVSDQVRAFLTRASAVAHPITYSLSNDGLGPVHELHLPKNLVHMAIAGVSGEMNPTPTVQNERMAMGIMYTLAQGQLQYKQKHGSFGTLEQLRTADFIPDSPVERSNYRFDISISGDKFEITAVPMEYGKGGKISLFIDETMILRGGDKSGATANASDPPIGF